MLTPKLFTVLPDYICTPDGLEIDRHGNLVLSCPNFADDAKSGLVVKIDAQRKVTKWFDVPPHPKTGIARNMGIAFDDDWNVYLCDNQGWSGRGDLVNKGRLLRLTVDDAGNIGECITVADGMEHPNGVRIYNGDIYVTQSSLVNVKDPSGLLVSCVYKFKPGEKNLLIDNTLDDSHIIATFITHNKDCQYGADGIAFDNDGNLYVGNFGDGEIYRITFNADGSVKENRPWAKNAGQLQSTDGMCFDAAGNMYIADFSANAVCRITPQGVAKRIAQSPDSDGLGGELNQPGEPIVWNGLLVASCFDLVTGPDKVNTGHSMPATLSMLEI